MAKLSTYLVYAAVNRQIRVQGRTCASVDPAENVGDSSLTWHLMDALNCDSEPDSLREAGQAQLIRARAWTSLWLAGQGLTQESAPFPRGEGVTISYSIDAMLVERATMRPAFVAWADGRSMAFGPGDDEHFPDGFTLSLSVGAKLARLDEQAAIDGAAAPCPAASPARRI